MASGAEPLKLFRAAGDTLYLVLLGPVDDPLAMARLFDAGHDDALGPPTRVGSIIAHCGGETDFQPVDLADCPDSLKAAIASLS